jgi:hypothetical protein
MAKPRALDQGHWIRKRRGTWIIAVPPEVRDMLGVTHRARLYWDVRRHGEAVLAVDRKPKEGRPPVRQLARELAAARKEIDAIRHRDERRDRGMYAEGFAHGYLQAYERLMQPDGPSAERGHRRQLYRWAYPDAAREVDPKQVAPRPRPGRPRLNARSRRAKHDAEAWRHVEVAGSIDQLPPPDPSPSPAVSEEEALAPEPSVTGQPQEH